MRIPILPVKGSASTELYDEEGVLTLWDARF